MRLSALALPAALLTTLLSLPAVAGTKTAPRSNALVSLAANHLGAPSRDVAVLVTANPLPRENASGSAAVVRVDDGSDGGIPQCHLLILAGRPATPAKVEAAERLPVCPRYNQGKGALLQRIELDTRRSAWRLRLGSERYDTMAKGLETLGLWALLADLGDGKGLRTVFERTSTSFKSKEEPATNQAEVCDVPVLRSGQAPETLELPCMTETMFDKVPKRQKIVYQYAWQGDRYLAK